MQFDALCYGTWIALLQFPLWIGFTLAISGVLNLILFRGVRGLFESLGLQALGMAVGGFMGAWVIAPQSGTLVTAFAMACISLYLVAISLDGQRRSMQLYVTKQQLRGKEHALQQQLLEIRSLQAELRDQARRDALTGLFNRRQLSEIVVHELARCAREGQPLCLLMMDIDHFKRVNDTYGHPAGDLVLQATAQLLQSRTRGSDWLFRYGGEEFLLLMPNTDVQAARSLADDVRIRYANTPRYQQRRSDQSRRRGTVPCQECGAKPRGNRLNSSQRGGFAAMLSVTTASVLKEAVVCPKFFQRSAQAGSATACIVVTILEENDQPDQHCPECDNLPDNHGA